MDGTGCSVLRSFLSWHSVQVCRLNWLVITLYMAKLIFCKAAVIGQTNSYEILTAVAAAGMGVCLCKGVYVLAHFLMDDCYYIC
jgi:hypothetical protein